MRRFAVWLVFVPVLAFANVPTPKEFLGFDVCEDYQLANYQQLRAYWKKLEQSSNRIKLVSIGKTEEGRDQLMAIISDPSNLKNLERHRRTAEQFAKVRGFKSPDSARKAAKDAKAVVWIDGGLHASETLGAQQLIETAYQLVNRKDEENNRILKDCVILLVHANPDGMDLVSDWYMRKSKLSERSLAGVPVMYQKYAGHDNNRDFYAGNLAETRNMNEILYRQWFPQIVYNHHQSAPAGTVMYIPPFRNPFNYHMDPLIQVSTDLVGLHMHQRLISEGKGGTVMRGGASFSTWWNGGLRTTTYFHNMIGILTETFGSPTPTRVPFLKERQIPSTDIPKPIDPGEWQLKQSLSYEIGANYAILDYASRYREQVLMTVYQSGLNQIEAGSRDNWTRYPARINELGASALSDPMLRDARGYVMSVEQRDPTALPLFLERLWRTGVEVEKLTERVIVNGKSFEPGSYLIRCNQPYRPHVIDMFEPQDHPNEFTYPGGPPIRPYDNAGYTLAYQMGIKFERSLEPVSAKTTMVNDLNEFRTLSKPKEAINARVGLWDRYGGSMESGWTRWLFDNFKVNYKLVFPPDIDAGNLRASYDAIVLPNLAISPRQMGNPQGIQDDESIPAEYRRRLGNLSQASIPKLKEFVEAGGTLIAIGSSALNLTKMWDVGWKQGLTQLDKDNKEVEIPSSQFFIPGSVLRLNLRQTELTKGYGDTIDVMFDESPVFVKTTGQDTEIVATFESEKPLRSGWAWGQEKLKGKVSILDIPVGKGRVVLFGPEVNFRGQSHDSFDLLFNALRRSAR